MGKALPVETKRKLLARIMQVEEDLTATGIEHMLSGIDSTGFWLLIGGDKDLAPTLKKIYPRWDDVAGVRLNHSGELTYLVVELEE